MLTDEAELPVLEKYPLDFDALEKGDDIPAEKIREIIKHPPGTDEYRFALMALQERITNELSERGLEVVIVQRKGALHVCTDKEASVYCYNEAQRGYRMIGRNLKRQIVVDKTNLTDEDQRLHESRMVVTSKMYQAATSARREARKLGADRPYMPPRIGTDSDPEESEG